MYPDQQNQNGGQPSYNPAPVPQQNAQGQYQVVPPLPAGPNTGHTGHNPYEFIVNPNAPKQRRNPFAGGSFIRQIAIIVGGAVLLMVVAAIIISALAPKGSTPGLTAIANRQQEIIRIATAATQQASTQDTKNFVANVELSITSSQQQTLSYLNSHGSKLKDKDLTLDQSAQTDSLLANAVTANNYDSVVTQNLSDQLKTYEGLLQSTFNQTSSATLKQQLQAEFSGANTLITQAKNLESSGFGA